MNEIKYSDIETLADFNERCCEAQMFACPECGHSLCVFCDDGCPGCDAGIVWSA